MKAPSTALVILVCANAFVWRDRAIQPATDFDHASFARELAQACAPLELERVHFEDEAMLPPSHSYYEGGSENSWLTVYAGYFSAGGLMTEQPHDPAVCYVALGWDIVSGPDRVEIGGRTVTRLTVERDDEQSVAHYWLQRPGGGDESQSWWRQRLISGRSDLVWVRIETDPHHSTAAEVAGRVRSISAAAQRALPR